MATAYHGNHFRVGDVCYIHGNPAHTWVVVEARNGYPYKIQAHPSNPLHLNYGKTLYEDAANEWQHHPWVKISSRRKKNIIGLLDNYEE